MSVMLLVFKDMIFFILYGLQIEKIIIQRIKKTIFNSTTIFKNIVQIPCNTSQDIGCDSTSEQMRYNPLQRSSFRNH